MMKNWQNIYVDLALLVWGPTLLSIHAPIPYTFVWMLTLVFCWRTEISNLARFEQTEFLAFAASYKILLIKSGSQNPLKRRHTDWVFFSGCSNVCRECVKCVNCLWYWTPTRHRGSTNAFWTNKEPRRPNLDFGTKGHQRVFQTFGSLLKVREKCEPSQFASAWNWQIKHHTYPKFFDGTQWLVPSSNIKGSSTCFVSPGWTPSSCL